MLTVAVRFRPESQRQQHSHHDIGDNKQQEDENKLNYEDMDRTTIQVSVENNYIRINNEFNLYFDHVLGSQSFQDDIFSASMRSKADDFLHGNNCCILTYGAKAAGKSYTMFGKLQNKNAVSHLGILPRSISYIIEKLHSFYKDKKVKDMDWNLFISFGNIYNDTITDLIDMENTKNIHLKKNKKTNEYYLKNLSQIKIKKISSFLKNMHLAHNNRNLYFSQHENITQRCHFFAVIKLNIYKINQITAEKVKISCNILNFIDCASYPQINYKPLSQNDSIDYQHLNFSFIQLNALMTRIAKKNDLTIDHRESKLTKLLYPIRKNGSGKLLMIINCTLNPFLRAETMATLRFGNLPTVDPFILSMMEKQRHKIKKLEQKNKELKVRLKTLKQKRRNADVCSTQVESLKVENEALTRKNNEYFVYQNKFEGLVSEYELLKLDYASMKKELYTQKNHNFWLMEDYNDLKVKYDNICNGEDIKKNQLVNKEQEKGQIGNLLKEIRSLREEKREHEMLLHAADNKLSEYESEIDEYEKELAIRNDEIRELREEKVYMNGSNNTIVSKLRNKKNKLEEKVINLRAEKAKDLVKFNKERHVMEAEVFKLQTFITNRNVIGKWRNLVHKRRIISLRKDMERATRKMKENYSENSEFRDQMYLLRKIAEQKCDVALSHQTHKKENKMNGSLPYSPSPSTKSTATKTAMNDTHINGPGHKLDYGHLVIETSGDFEAEMIGLLPTNLKRIHYVIQQLTNKLMAKNGQLHALRIKYDKLNRKYINQLQYDDKASSHSSEPNNNKHMIRNSSFGEYLPSILDKLHLNEDDGDGEDEEQVDEDTSSDLKQEESKMNINCNASNLKQFTFRARAHTQNESECKMVCGELEGKQKQLRLLQEALSITFHINNEKNTRIKLNVAMSPKDVFHNLCSHSLLRNDNFTLIIQHNVAADVDRIVIPSQNTSMSFWELIVEFGILNLLHFNICTNEYNAKLKYAKNSHKKEDKQGSGIWNMFNKK